MHDLAVADVHADVRDAAVVEDQVTGLQIPLGHGGARRELGLGGAGQGDADLLVGGVHQPGTVEGRGPGGAHDITLADLGEGVADGLLGTSGTAARGRGGRIGLVARSGGWGGSGAGALAGRLLTCGLLLLALFLQLPETLLLLGTQAVVDLLGLCLLGLVLLRELFLGRPVRLERLGDGFLLATECVQPGLLHLQGLQVSHAPVGLVLDGGQPGQERGVVAAAEKLARDVHATAVELHHRQITEVRPQLGNLRLLGGQILLEGLELALRLLGAGDRLDELGIQIRGLLVNAVQLLLRGCDGVRIGGCNGYENDAGCDEKANQTCAERLHSKLQTLGDEAERILNDLQAFPKVHPSCRTCTPLRPWSFCRRGRVTSPT